MINHTKNEDRVITIYTKSIHFRSLITWFIQLTMSFFLTQSTDYLTIDEWLSWMIPASFLALSDLNFCLTLENTNSIGLNSGLYGTLNIHLNPSLAISAFDLSLLWADRLSINKAILSSTFNSLSSCRYCLNFWMLTESL